MIKSGVIFVISNIGSIGRDIYRISMTKSSKPDEYVSVMTPVVPFPFDIHLKIFSEDAIDTLRLLHQRFYDKRVNIVNERREFFRLSLDEIYRTVEEISQQTGALTILKNERVPQAYEYRRIAAQKKQHSTSKDTDLEENQIA
ncbi:GIY-YIG nuclease family protein [Iningainema tapete]|uniref:GIY-YIG nuclease family protein n=1 Tax=Iningainema tapete BLCC-T55 TaxID=2748662 RepID=A0A8J6XQC7_9CYAN|nr:GIY-YIG nuclease family protein [Iningainema tapete]MBD2777597.1 GIY-YIG nuclease family protein [Iningainema tapete BLCC-T55]